jgi:hypothetical protein
MWTTALLLVLASQDAVTQPPRLRHRPPTEAERASAYPDAATRSFVARARAERLRVDSTLNAYRATSYERLTLGGSVGGSAGAGGRERLLGRRETVGQVSWSRRDGAHLALLGRRGVQNSRVALPNPVGDQLAPIPWYPGMDALWLPSPTGAPASSGGEAQADTTDLVHPLAVGSESYYTFALGDSAVITLPDTRRLVLRELRTRPRQPRWNLSVGSYWFDTERVQLVRAVYRLSVPYDVWTEVDNTLVAGEQGPPWYLKFLAQPLKGELQAVTLEYGLYENRFWLPRVRRVDGSVKAGPLQLAVTIEQGFRYTDVNAVADVPTIPAANLALRASFDSLDGLWRQLWRDRRALRTRDDTAAWDARRVMLDSAWAQYSARATAQRNADCQATGVRYLTSTRLGTRLTTRVAVPCDSVKLANAPEFGSGLFAERAPVYASTMDEATREALGLDVQAAFAPQRITWHTGLEYLRYNRVEALSVGAALRQQLGAGWSWEANARGSLGDQQVNGELLATRTNGGGDLTVTGYRRLVQADDYGLAFGAAASLQSIVRALDEQFYYRAAGGELTRRYSGRGAGALRLETRLFGEWQEGVGTQAALSLPWLVNRSRTFDRGVVDTLPHLAGGAFGGALRLLAARGAEEEGWRLGSAWRLEGVAGTWRYVRAAADLSLQRALPGRVRVTTTVSGGTSTGGLPTHRLWNLGGWQTVRGVRAGSLRGEAYWMSRAELTWARTGWWQPGLFADAGWAGARRDLSRSDGARLSVGGGVGMFGLPIRLDAARALEPASRWQVNLYAPIRF